MKNLVPCDCGNGHKVEIRYPNSEGVTPCCSCTVEKYRMLYGEPQFTVTPVLVTQEAAR